MKLFKQTLLAAAVLSSAGAMAQTTAIINAQIHTASEQGVIKNGSVIIEDGKIKAITTDAATADVIIDAQGKIVTPGFIGSMNQLGLVEVGAVASSRDGNEKKGGITFDPSLAFNPKSTLIAYARKGGITRDVIAPSWGESPFVGLSSTVNLSGEFGTSVVDSQNAIIVNLGGTKDGSRAASLSEFIDTLEEQQTKIAKAKKSDKKDDKAELSKKEKLLTAALNGEKPVVVRVSRAQDMLELIKVKERFGIDLVISGAEDALPIKAELAAAKVPVILSAMANLPGDFDSLNASLETAGELEKAGVLVALTIAGDSSHNVYQLRYDAGNAIANGMSREGALKAITSNVADIFNIEDAGSIEVGKAADLAVWSADPFEFSTTLEKVMINGIEVSTEARHDKLRDRYMAETNMPRAYTK
ncbi:Imidazolonepropionase [Pseudoalteromonas sp. P1-9]|uniref:amidohydrolase family protein n=1 Tax=Pseudoalteromonas sp. P1-9 TaxID=1710354 RepID=UPI0006D62E1B|nr:amidohydrolase family protein [Pseudoalteromonas sp. P1-9]KPV95276.1 Imidazolonepropionase [Pseudoalteromonas sp. P1-9]